MVYKFYIGHKKSKLIIFTIAACFDVFLNLKRHKCSCNFKVVYYVWQTILRLEIKSGKGWISSYVVKW